MSTTKRSAQEQIERYQRKLRKLEEKENRQRLEALNTQPNQSNPENNGDPPRSEMNGEPPGNENNGDQPPPAEPAPSHSDPVPSTNDSSTDQIPIPVTMSDDPPLTRTEPETTAADTALDSAPVQELDPDLLMALGDPSDDRPKFGPNIHPNLAERWLPLLRKGLPKESKEKLLKEYLIPENCSLLQAPKLNPEIAAATTDMTRNRDKKLEAFQQQLGIGLSAVNTALTKLLTGEDKLSAIKHLSDGCRILTDLHFMETQSRIKLVTPGLAKPFLNIIQDSDRDDTLFGNKLPEKIKASKAIEKQGLQIKKPTVHPKHNFNATTSTAPRAPSQYQSQGNWQGPLRYPSNRGGRGGPRKYTTAGAARKPAPQPQSRAAGQNKSRAAAQQ